MSVNQWAYVEEVPLTDRQAERFRSHVATAEGDGCWNWGGALNREGYGRVRVDSRPRLAHRVALVIEGVPMPEGTVIDHLCRNRRCVRPAHLEVVTPRVNLERGECPSAVGVLARYENRCGNGHDLAEVGVYQRSHRGKSDICRACHRAAQARYKAKRLHPLAGAIA